MYSKTPHIGKVGLTGFGEPRTCNNVVTWCGQLLPKDDVIHVKPRRRDEDPYLTGYNWFESGKKLEKHEAFKFLMPKVRAEFNRLFLLGFNDAKQIKEENDQNKTKSRR